MISFIVIGLNEARTLGMVFESINDYVAYNNINNYEIIYVDSKSEDESINIAKSFEKVKIFEITQDRNAAIARNIGAKEAKGDVLIFLDADMQIVKEFHNKVFKDNKLIHPFVSGQLENIYYDNNWKVVNKKLHFPKLNKDIYTPLSGGFFIIEKELWESVNGMNTKFRRSQDIDFALRLAKKGVLLLRKKDMFIIHHTVSYLDDRRAWKMLFDGSLLYQTSVMLRDHLFNKYFYKKFLRTNYTLIILAISILGGIFYSKYLLLLHPFVIILKVLLTKKSPKFIIYYYLRDIFSFVGFFLFFPKQKKLIYKSIK